jgi:hypothetical protein
LMTLIREVYFFSVLDNKRSCSDIMEISDCRAGQYIHDRFVIGCDRLPSRFYIHLYNCAGLDFSFDVFESPVSSSLLFAKFSITF